MLTERLPLVWAFAGGCLSGVLALGLWRADSTMGTHPARASASRAGDERAEPSEPRHETREQARLEDASGADAPEREADAAPKPPNTHAAPLRRDDAEATSEQGSSVADVLNRLESQYRQVLAGTTPPSTPERTLAADAPAPAVSVPVAVAAAAPVAEAPAPVTPQREPAVALAAAPQPESAPPPPAPVAPAEVAPATPAAPSPLPAEVAERLAAQGTGQPRDVYLGNVQNNVYLGDVYQGQVVQMQQELAMLQYMQLLSLSPYARFGGRGRGVPRGFAAQPAPAPAFRSRLTNPDNPWGFDFPPTNYVK